MEQAHYALNNSYAGFAAAALAALGIWYYKRSEKAWTGNGGPRQSSPTKGTPGQKIVLHGFWSPAGSICVSPAMMLV